MASQAHGEPITGSSLTASPFATKKKNTESEIEPNQPITSLAPGITSRHRWQRDQTPIQKQTKHKELNKPNTEHIGVYQKKKKSPIHKPKSNPVNHLPMDGHVAAASSSSLSSFAWSPLIADQRSENADRSASAPVLGVRCSMLPPALRQGISLFFLSDSFSVSRSLIFISVFLSVFSFFRGVARNEYLGGPGCNRNLLNIILKSIGYKIINFHISSYI